MVDEQPPSEPPVPGQSEAIADSPATRVRNFFRAVREGDRDALPGLLSDFRQMAVDQTEAAAMLRVAPLQLLTELSSVRDRLANAEPDAREGLEAEEASLLRRLANYGNIPMAQKAVSQGTCELCPACTACLLTPGVPDFEFVGAFLLIT